MVRQEMPERQFASCLELGAGRCLQSPLLLEFCSSVLATDLNEERLMSANVDRRIKRAVLDAENFADEFEDQKFDLIFSSNMLEHLPNPAQCVRESAKVLSEGGIMVHIVPNATWRLLCTLLYYPVKARNLSRKIFGSPHFSKFGKVQKQLPKSQENNIKSSEGEKKKRFSFSPPVHGVSPTLRAEFKQFRKSSWTKLFADSGVRVALIKSGPLSTGYGLGFPKLKFLLEKLGLASAYIFFLVPDNETSTHISLK